jgi:hypothetical protein
MILTLLIIWLIIAALVAFAFDTLIKYQHDNYYECWMDDGNPRGMFYSPADGSYMAMCLLTFFPSPATPGWVTGDVEAERIYGRYLFWARVNKWYAICFIPLIVVATSI